MEVWYICRARSKSCITQEILVSCGRSSSVYGVQGNAVERKTHEKAPCGSDQSWTFQQEQRLGCERGELANGHASSESGQTEGVENLAWIQVWLRMKALKRMRELHRIERNQGCYVMGEWFGGSEVLGFRSEFDWFFCLCCFLWFSSYAIFIAWFCGRHSRLMVLLLLPLNRYVSYKPLRQ